LYDRGESFQRIGRAEYLDESGRSWYIAGCRRDGLDRARNRPGSFPTEIDDDVRAEYWSDIRRQPERVTEPVTYG
jgi:hypothetical protein